jgi:cytochrome c biogenesis protein
MSALEETVGKASVSLPVRKAVGESLITRLLKLLSSVRLGVTLLILLGLACLIGMLVMQQNVDGFDRYFAQLTPSQRLVYGRLGIFDIYHSWYFNALLAVLSLNIVLASIDRFPKTWTYVSKPVMYPPIRWLKDQRQTSALANEGTSNEIAARISDEMKKAGWRKIRVGEKNGRTFVFGESGVWNRFGAYAVHVALLTIFAGGFLTAQLGSTGQMPVTPGQSTNLMFDTVVDLDKASQITKELPFEIYCSDMRQKLIKKDGSISASNTIDWMTFFTIKDETGTHEAFVQMNKPFDYRGYRFFQASFTSVGRARNITVKATPAGGGEPLQVSIPRDGSTTLADGTRINFAEFRGNFRIGKEDPNENTTDYQNPGAVLNVIKPGAVPQTAYAFGPQMAGMPVASKPVGGYSYQLVDFEKVADQHVLSVQRDPGATVVYVGFVLLFLMLVAVFFFSHQRVWAAIGEPTEGSTIVVFGGNSNRNLNAFDEKFKRFIANLTTASTEAEKQ